MLKWCVTIGLWRSIWTCRSDEQLRRCTAYQRGLDRSPARRSGCPPPSSRHGLRDYQVAVNISRKLRRSTELWCRHEPVALARTGRVGAARRSPYRCRAIGRGEEDHAVLAHADHGLTTRGCDGDRRPGLTLQSRFPKMRRARRTSNEERAFVGLTPPWRRLPRSYIGALVSSAVAYGRTQVRRLFVIRRITVAVPRLHNDAARVGTWH